VKTPAAPHAWHCARRCCDQRGPVAHPSSRGKAGRAGRPGSNRSTSGGRLQQRDLT
jgi:hypothetical protein